MVDADPGTGWQDLARHDVVMATIREFTERAGAVHVAVLLDRGPDREPPLLECEPGQPLTISQGEENFIVPPQALDGVRPLPVEAPKPVPASALSVDPALGEVEAPIGVVEALADAVRRLAQALGGRSVAMADFATRSGEPLSIAAREGEPVVLAFGDHEFQVPGPGSDPPIG
jgi:hypothetical protein